MAVPAPCICNTRDGSKTTCASSYTRRVPVLQGRIPKLGQVYTLLALRVRSVCFALCGRCLTVGLLDGWQLHCVHWLCFRNYRSSFNWLRDRKIDTVVDKRAESGLCLRRTIFVQLRLAIFAIHRDNDFCSKGCESIRELPNL